MQQDCLFEAVAEAERRFAVASYWLGHRVSSNGFLNLIGLDLARIKGR